MNSDPTLNSLIPAEIRRRIEEEYDSDQELPDSPGVYVLNRYGIDLTSEYAGLPIAIPFGKASGQLSMMAQQVADDVAAGLGFVVLKTVIAQDAQGEQSMAAWATRESRMVVEPIQSARGEVGWTVTWKGRGWWQSFEDYLILVRESRRIATESGALIVPSCKYHLPASPQEPWRQSEYDDTTRAILNAWNIEGAPDSPMPIEKDFSPTLAGSDRSQARERILDWLRETPRRMRAAVPENGRLRVGLKLFNSLFDDDFQVTMLKAIHRASAAERPDYYIYGNRLFDPEKFFEGHRGVAYGGPDLSDRNLRVMKQFVRSSSGTSEPRLPWSATGNIVSGRIAVEYALQGASSFQLHTMFQLPQSEFRRRTGTRTQKALHELLFHPQDGFLVCLLAEANRRGLARHPLKFQDVVGGAETTRRVDSNP